jgi:hypothetical protein
MLFPCPSTSKDGRGVVERPLATLLIAAEPFALECTLTSVQAHLITVQCKETV